MSSRRLPIFAGLVFLAESAFYAVVPPLAPGFVRDLHMSTTEIGILVAAYPAGVLIATIPAIVLVNSTGVRMTTIAGLGALIAATLGFAWGSTPLLLDGARLVQGVGGQIAWAGALAWLTSSARADRRGSAIGGAVGAALIGMVLGPPLGAMASNLGRGLVFSAMALVLLALAVFGPPPVAADVARREWLPAIGQLFHSRSANVGNSLLFVIGVVNGTVASLVPLLVTQRHGSAVTIAVILSATYLTGSILNVSVGRLSDRIGRLVPTVIGLVVAAASIPFLPHIEAIIALAVVTIIASAAVSALWTPTAAMVSDGVDTGQGGQAVAVAILNAAWAAGVTGGAIVVSRVADVAGFTAPFILVGAACGLAAVATVVTGRPASANKEKAWTLG